MRDATAWFQARPQPRGTFGVLPLLCVVAGLALVAAVRGGDYPGAAWWSAEAGVSVDRSAPRAVALTPTGSTTLARGASTRHEEPPHPWRLKRRVWQGAGQSDPRLRGVGLSELAVVADLSLTAPSGAPFGTPASNAAPPAAAAPALLLRC